MRSRFRLRPLFWLAAAAASFVALTCDDTKPIARLPEKMAEAFCAHQFACCSPLEMSSITSDRYTTEEECLPFATIAARQQLGTVAGSLDQGRISVDPAALDACVKAYRESGCSSGYQYPNISPLPNVLLILAYCPDLFVGHVPDNSACNLLQECRRGSRCASFTVSPYAGLPGTPVNVSLTPTPGQCVPYQKAGEPCNTSLDCDPASNLACRDFVCGLPAQEGQPCMFTMDQFTGQPISNCDASKRLYCNIYGTQVCWHYPREGEPCQFIQPPVCDPDPALALTCNEVSATCRKPNNEGDACGAPAIPPCRADLACHATRPDGIGICGALPALGEACVDRCASPNACVFGVCTPPGTRRIGSSCAGNADCASFNCTTSTPFGSPSPSPVCAPPLIYPQCIGGAVTVGNISGFGGSSGSGGSKGPGFAGTFGRGGTVGTAGVFGSAGFTGAGGGSGGTGPTMLGCQVSDLAPEDPIIADFSFGDMVPIGGIFTYGSPGPIATIENGALHVTATTVGTTQPQFWGAGIYFNGNASGTDCIDGTGHVGVLFDISGFIEGPGCTAQYATNDSAHTNNAADPKGAGNVMSFSPQAPFKVTPDPMTLSMPFVGFGAPTGGNPAIPIDKSKLTSLQWQFTTQGDPMSRCNVDIVIDNVRFF